MYHLFGTKPLIENLIILAKTADPNLQIETLDSLKGGYVNYLRKIQPEATLPRESGLVFTSDDKIVSQLIELFGAKSNLNDLRQESVIQGTSTHDKPVLKQAQLALNTFENLDSNLFALFQLTINYCFFAQSTKAGGGSSSGAIGCIWLNPRGNWSLQDYCEFFVHELTHNFLFLDERRYGHYRDYSKLQRPENFAFSSILNKERPLDKVVHSLVVATEVLAFRKRCFDVQAKTYLHPGTSVLIESIGKTLESLKRLPTGLMTERAWDIIDRVERSFAKETNNERQQALQLTS